MKMETKDIVLSRGLPKTGQSLSLDTGDDGYYESGWWEGLTNAGNRTRFVSRAVNGDLIVFDRATGLTWTRDFSQAGGNNGDAIANWAAALAYCTALDFAEFTDWRLPNMNEIISIVDWSKVLVSIPLHTPFINFSATKSLWSSTTVGGSPTHAFGLITSVMGVVSINIKSTSSYGLISVRGGRQRLSI